MFLPALAPLLIFIAFLLLLLVSLSVPIIKSIDLFRLTANASSSILKSSASGSVTFGVWGYCVSALKVSVFGSDRSMSDGQCSKAHLGYTFDSTVADAVGASSIQNAISRTTTAALLLHPLAAALAFLTLLVSLFILRRGSNGTSRLPSALTTGLAILTSILTTIVFLIDVIVVAVVRGRVHKASDSLDLTWGNAVWMTLGAAIALWISTIGAMCGVFGLRSTRKRTTNTY
ncbi:hypothetical protein D9613_002969 [Agrocybe pediades]|uniref:Pali-domain-containing protein n=1 Tax=Agrocybe pediades TaxID=84607 RepID=A0A8H4VLS6_9AGAR|nr:hypothetical protein D9613_002969 [Agrocybe pediades]KAF9567544.1 pali-domain-containing protein [Agrocybe pediades]